MTLTGLMAANTVHTISIAGISDMAGNTMATVASLFTTGSDVDLSGPSATVVFSPSSGATGVPITVAPSVTFGEPIDPVRALTISSQGYGVLLYAAGTGQPVAVTYSVSADFRTVIVTPTVPLQSGTQYQLLAYVGITDLAGNAYGSYNAITFTTQ